MGAKTIRFKDVKEELLQDPEVREAYEALQPVYQLTRLRILRGLTQKQLAELVGTKQPSIARLESGASVGRPPGDTSRARRGTPVGQPGGRCALAVCGVGGAPPGAGRRDARGHSFRGDFTPILTSIPALAYN